MGQKAAGIPDRFGRSAHGRAPGFGRILAAALAGLLLAAGAAGAAGPAALPSGALPGAAKSQPAAQPRDALGRSTPFGTVLGFIKAAEREDYGLAAEFLDAQEIPRRASRLAQDMSTVLDAADLRDLSRSPDGDLEDGLPPDRERVGTVKTDSGRRDIFLERVRRGTEPPVWLFSSDTLKWVPGAAASVGIGPIEKRVAGTFLERRLLGYPLWRLIGVLLVLPVSYIIARAATRLLLAAVPLLLRRLERQQIDSATAKLRWPLSLLLMAIVLYATSFAGFSAASRVFWGYVAATVATISITWLGLRLIDDVAALIGGGLRPRVGSGGVAVERFLVRVSKFLVAIVGVLVLFYIAGVNLTALLTGVGIGGIALALAAQKSLENLFGAMTIISDNTIRVGDYCRAGDHSGTVEDIGMRTTRLRTPDRTVVSIPNGQLITMSLENFALRDKFLFSHRIRLDYETSADQLRRIVAELRTALAEHPKVEARTARVNLSAFRDVSIEVEVFAYVLEGTFEAFLVVQEELLFRTMDIVRVAGARFALPLALPPAKSRRA